MRRVELPPLSFLLEASQRSIQDLELAALNRSSNLGKGVKGELELWVEQTAAAMLARWMIENRDALLDAGIKVSDAGLESLFETVERKKSA